MSEIIVAIAAPIAPMCNPQMNTISRRKLSTLAPTETSRALLVSMLPVVEEVVVVVVVVVGGGGGEPDWIGTAVRSCLTFRKYITCKSTVCHSSN